MNVFTYSDNHAVVLLVRATTAEEADDEADDSNDYNEHSSTVDVIAKERKVVAERRLKYRSADDEHEANNLHHTYIQ